MESSDIVLETELIHEFTQLKNSRIKPLKWENVTNKNSLASFTVFAEYNIYLTPDIRVDIWEPDDRGIWESDTLGYFATVELAKWASQTNHDSRVLKLIEPCVTLDII